MPIKTCGECEHVTRKVLPAMSGVFLGCGKTGLVIPHASKGVEGERGKFETTFWRVPMECPRPVTEVVKQKEKRPHKDWLIKIIDLRNEDND